MKASYEGAIEWPGVKARLSHLRNARGDKCFKIELLDILQFLFVYGDFLWRWDPYLNSKCFTHTYRSLKAPGF